MATLTGMRGRRRAAPLVLLAGDTAWLAGLLEGEGCFTTRRRAPGERQEPRVQVRMTDADVIARVALLWGVTVRESPNGPGRKPIYTAAVVGAKARDVMRAVQPWMGRRRRARIKELLEL